MLSPVIYESGYIHSAIQKPNGSIVLVSYNYQYGRKLTEIDTTGSTVRQYQSSLSGDSGVSFADSDGRIVITDPNNRIELLDCEMNLLEYTGPQLNQNQIPEDLHYNGERNEIVGICEDFPHSTLTIFRFRE